MPAPTLALLLLLAGCAPPRGDPKGDTGDTSSDTSSDTSGDTSGDTSTDTSTAPSCADRGKGAGELPGRYDATTIEVEGSDKTYILHANWWFAWDGQSVAWDGLGFTVHDPNGVDVGADQGNPAGYPSLYVGSYAGRTSAGSGLPRAVSTLGAIPTRMDSDALEGDPANRNASWDVWLTAGPDPLPADQYSPGPGGAYLMVWLYDPAGRQPRGSEDHPDHVVPGVDGAWDVWIDETDPPCISYVATRPVDDAAFDLGAFLRDAVDQGYGITDDMYLSVVFGGFEIWSGGDGVTLDAFCVDVP